MKPRHAAALALVGWYLMLPPLTENPPPHAAENALVDTQAPLSQWDSDGSFDSAIQCNRARGQATENVKNMADQEFSDEKAVRARGLSVDEKVENRTLRIYSRYLRTQRAKCIASGDPPHDPH